MPTKRRIIAAVVALLAAGGLVALVPSAAQAGGCTAGIWCSQIYNNLSSGNYLKIAVAWCGDADRLSQDAIPCAGYPTHSQTTYFEHWGAYTANDEDWDAFRVEPGCLVKFTVVNRLSGLYLNETSDRRGRGTEWIRVHNYEAAFVDSRSCG